MIDIGMNVGTYSDNEQLDLHLSIFKSVNIQYIRAGLRSWNNAADVALSKENVIRMVQNGFNVIFGLSSSDTLTAANWGDYEAAILDAAAWAEANGVYEFQIGNELEQVNDGTTLTDIQLVENLKALATSVKAVYNGLVSYATYVPAINEGIWVAGKGDLDILSLNIYYSETWKTFLNSFVNTYGSDNTLSEFSLSNISLDTYSTDEKTQADALEEMIKYIENIGISRAYFYYFRSNLFGALKEDDITYRKIWNVLADANKIKGGAGSSMIRGLSHG